MRKPSDLQNELIQTDSTDLWDGSFRIFPNELITHIFSFLSLNDYVNVASTSEKHHQALIANAFINSYDPQLLIFLKVAVHFIQQTSGKVCEESRIPLSIIKEIIPIYAEVKAQVLTMEIKLKAKVLIAMLDCSLSGVDDKKKLKWDFLSQIFENYFKINAHFIFNMNENLPPVFANPTKLDYLIDCIKQTEARSFRLDKFDTDKIDGSMVIYFYAQPILSSFPRLHTMPAEVRETALKYAEGYCIAAFNRGAANALFLLRLIYQRLVFYKIDSKLSSEQANTPFEFEKRVAKFLGIGKLDKKSLYEILGETFFKSLSFAPMKTLKVLKKLLASNTMDEVRDTERNIKLWKSLIKEGKHSLEFLNTFSGKIEKLQELSSTGFLSHICESPAASMIGAMLKKKASTCELIYRELGFEKLVQCSEIVVETRATNLLQALGDLETDQLTKILADAQGNIESLKQVVITQSIMNSSVLSSVNFFASSSNKRPHEQTQTTEPELTDSDPKVPRLSNSKAEEE